MEITTRDNKAFTKLSELILWEQNPRDIKDEDLARLVEQIKDAKAITGDEQIKPLIITPEGVVLGGNMRMKAFEQLGVTDVWVSIVDVKSDADKVKIALIDNDSAGYYVESKLDELLKPILSEINLSNFKIQLGQPIDLTKLLGSFERPPVGVGVGSVSDRQSDANPNDKYLDSFLNGTIRQIIIYFDVPTYETVLADLSAVRQHFQVEDNTGAFLKLVEFWKEHKDEQAGN